MARRVSRREALQGTGAAVLSGVLAPGRAREDKPDQRAVTRGRLKQSVARWPYARIPMPAFCRVVAGMGLTAIDLLQPDEWADLTPFGLTCSLAYADAGSIPKGLNDPSNHDGIVRGLTTNIPLAAEAGIPNVITFFGNVQPGMSEAQAVDNCVTGLNRVRQVAEDHGVTICVELLNSKVDHKGYQGDHTAFGVQVVRAVDSPRVKLLYDIYHMQIMEGDLIRTIHDAFPHIAHFHTGGVPGRHELDDTQEVNWPAVCTAIVDLGYGGYVAHEFQPTRDPLTSLREAVVLCDV